MSKTCDSNVFQKPSSPSGGTGSTGGTTTGTGTTTQNSTPGSSGDILFNHDIPTDI